MYKTRLTKCPACLWIITVSVLACVHVSVHVSKTETETYNWESCLWLVLPLIAGTNTGLALTKIGVLTFRHTTVMGTRAQGCAWLAAIPEGLLHTQTSSARAQKTTWWTLDPTTIKQENRSDPRDDNTTHQRHQRFPLLMNAACAQLAKIDGSIGLLSCDEDRIEG